MKTISVTALHYGLDYLADALLSVIDVVDEAWVLYTPVGSHGHRTNTPCPEHMADLYQVAQAAAGDKLRWYAGMWDYEGAQRDAIYQLAPDADVILTLDADEVWPAGLAAAAIAELQASGARYGRMALIHFWRSFGRAMLDDAAAPIRIVNVHGEGETTLQGKLLHFGYAQNSAVVQYKIETHGHKGEWRAEWWAERWLPNAQRDVHPTGVDYWHPVAYDPTPLLTPSLMTHRYRMLEVIP